MADHQRLVDEIRSVLHSSDQTLTDALKQLASAYVGACQEVNARLRRCADFLQQGLRSEAIQLAQTGPVLLDDLAILDFPERSQWDEISLTYRLPSPPMLNIEAAEALNEAYADTLPLEGLLRQHRLLALARASLGQRLVVMRRISALDTKNPVWADDIQTFEKARFGQIEKEAKQAIAGNHVARVAALAEEVGRTRWLALPPPSLINYVETAANRFHQRKLRERLESLEVRLNEAHSALDVARAKALRGQWDEVSKHADLPLEDPLRDRVAPALEWLKKEERRQAADRKYQTLVAHFERALSASSSGEELALRYNAVKSYVGDLPAVIEERYRKKIEGFILAQRRRRLQIVGIVLAATLLLLGVIVFWIVETSQASRAAESAQKLRKLLDSDQLEEARKFLDNLAANDPSVARHPELADTAKVLVNKEVKSQKLARTAEEKAALGKLLEQGRQRQKQRDEAFLSHLNICRNKLDKLEAEAAASPDSPFIADLDREIAAEFSRLMEEARTVSDALRQRGQELWTRFTSLRTSLDRQKLENQTARRLTRALYKAESFGPYMNAVAEYLKAFPDGPRSEDLKKAVKERDLWDQVFEWHQLIKPWIEKPFGMSPNDAKAATERCHKFLSTRKPLIDAENLDDFLQCVEALSQQEQDQKDSAAAKLLTLFSDIAIRNLWMVQLDDGKIYYLKKDPEDEIQQAKKQGGKAYVNFRYVNSFDGKEMSKIVKPQQVRKHGRAPQSVVADEIQGLSRTLDKAGWDETLLELAKKLVAKKDMDPILRLNLLKAVVEYAGRGSYPLALALKDCAKKIKASKVDPLLAWIDPTREAGDSRTAAKDLINDLPTMESVQKACAENRQKLAASIAQSNLVAVGWLARTRYGWQCLSEGSAPDKAELCVVLPRENARAEYQVVGSVEEGKFVIRGGNRNALMEGRLVFARNPQSR